MDWGGGGLIDARARAPPRWANEQWTERTVRSELGEWMMNIYAGGVFFFFFSFGELIGGGRCEGTGG